MRVILDTNIFLSALLSGRGPPAQIVDAWYAGRFDLVTSTAQIEEFKIAARYERIRPYLTRAAVGRSVNALRTAEVLTERIPRAVDSPDPGDDYLLAMAIAGAADFLVTGDKALLSMKRIGSTRIVSPRRFVSLTGLR